MHLTIIINTTINVVISPIAHRLMAVEDRLQRDCAEMQADVDAKQKMIEVCDTDGFCDHSWKESK